MVVDYSFFSFLVYCFVVNLVVFIVVFFWSLYCLSFSWQFLIVLLCHPLTYVLKIRILTRDAFNCRWSNIMFVWSDITPSIVHALLFLAIYSRLCWHLCNRIASFMKECADTSLPYVNCTGRKVRGCRGGNQKPYIEGVILWVHSTRYKRYKYNSSMIM